MEDLGHDPASSLVGACRIPTLRVEQAVGSHRDARQITKVDGRTPDKRHDRVSQMQERSLDGYVWIFLFRDGTGSLGLCVDHAVSFCQLLG
jgi:hypothetical protein